MTWAVDETRDGSTGEEGRGDPAKTTKDNRITCFEWKRSMLSHIHALLFCIFYMAVVAQSSDKRVTRYVKIYTCGFGLMPFIFLFGFFISFFAFQMCQSDNF